MFGNQFNNICLNKEAKKIPKIKIIYFYIFNKLAFLKKFDFTKNGKKWNRL